MHNWVLMTMKWWRRWYDKHQNLVSKIQTWNSSSKQIDLNQAQSLLHNFSRMLRLSLHSMSMFLILDLWSASKFSSRLIYSADYVKFLRLAHSKICATMVNNDILVIMERSIHAMTVLFSDLSLTWVSLWSLHKYLNSSNTIFNSRQLIWFTSWHSLWSPVTMDPIWLPNQTVNHPFEFLSQEEELLFTWSENLCSWSTNKSRHESARLRWYFRYNHLWFIFLSVQITIILSGSIVTTKSSNM